MYKINKNTQKFNSTVYFLFNFFLKKCLSRTTTKRRAFYKNSCMCTKEFTKKIQIKFNYILKKNEIQIIMYVMEFSSSYNSPYFHGYTKKSLRPVNF